MTYKDKITEAMTWLGKQKKSVFIGEGLINAQRIYGTMNGVSNRDCLEMPIAENLITGVAMGLALEGFKPIIVFQRMDFMLVAADAIINHMTLLPSMSGKQFTFPIIIRAIIGSQHRKFWVGEQHNHDFAHIFSPYIDTIKLTQAKHILMSYMNAYKSSNPVLIIEEKDLY